MAISKKFALLVVCISCINIMYAFNPVAFSSKSLLLSIRRNVCCQSHRRDQRYRCPNAFSLLARQTFLETADSFEPQDKSLESLDPTEFLANLPFGLNTRRTPTQENILRQRKWTYVQCRHPSTPSAESSSWFVDAGPAPVFIYVPEPY